MNYLREYGQHNYVQKNDGKSGDQMRELGMKLNEGKDKPKNEVKKVVHQGNDANCEYCGFSIKAGTNAFIDNFGKNKGSKEINRIKLLLIKSLTYLDIKSADSLRQEIDSTEPNLSQENIATLINDIYNKFRKIDNNKEEKTKKIN